MRIGTICYATSRGLGHLCRDFHRHGIITDVLVIEHPGIPTQDWYPDAPRTHLRSLDTKLMRDFVQGKDACLFFETPFWWDILPYCREIGVRTYLVTMYECTPIHRPHPHKYLCPSVLDAAYFMDWNSVFLPLPAEYPWRLRERAEHFVHNGGYLGLKGTDGHNREGTTILIEALRHVKSPIRLTMRVQENVPAAHQRLLAADPRVEYLAATVPYEELYATGDVAVGAQKWNGCSLPLQEAFASGMLVMNTHRFPMNTWLPEEPLIPVSRYEKHAIGGAYLEFAEAIVRPEDMAATIDAWYGKDITRFSEQGRQWAAAHSWEALRPKWLEALAT